MRATIAETFDQQYRVDEATGCFVWLRARKGRAVKSGYYGCLWSNGTRVGAHRFAWTRRFGAIPSGMEVSHRCHNSLCVNVEHLCLETRTQNQARSAAALRYPHKLTPESVQDIRRSCANGVFHRVMAEKYGVSRRHVCDVANGIGWGHVDA